jgi:hypothetical protein
MALSDLDLVDENRFYVDRKMEGGDGVAHTMVTTRVDVAQCTDGLHEHGLRNMVGDEYAEGRQVEEPLQMGWWMRNSVSKMEADFTMLLSW